MGKGRKPISNALKVLKGTDQPCRMREEISYEKITKIPKAPDYMCVAGKKVYKITAQQLADQGILNVVNINAVMMYANEMGKYIEAEKKLSGSENDRVVKEISDKGGVRYVRNPLDKMASGMSVIHSIRWRPNIWLMQRCGLSNWGSPRHRLLK